MKLYVIGNRENTKFVSCDYGEYFWVDDPTRADRRSTLEQAVKMYKEQREWFDRQTIVGPELEIYELTTVEVDYDEWSAIEDELERMDDLFKSLTENEKNYLRTRLKA